MFGKNRNKKVGICLMVVTACLVLAALWAVLAAPETALAKRPGSDVAYDVVIDTVGFVHQSAPLLTDNGDGKPWIVFTRKTVTPTGPDGEPTYAIGGPKTGVVVQFKERKGVLSGLTVDGNDANHVWHVSDVVPVVPAFTLKAGTDQDIVVNVDNISIHRRNKNGPVIGTIAIGTIRLTVVQ